MISFFRGKTEEKRPLHAWEYFNRYYEKQGITIRQSTSEIDPEQKFIASFYLSGQKVERSVSAITWSELYDKMEAIKKEIEIDRIGIGENERREFLKIHSLATILQSHSVIYGITDTTEACRVFCPDEEESV